MHYRLPRDIQDHANDIKRTTDGVTTNLKLKVNDGPGAGRREKKAERCHGVHGKGGDERETGGRRGWEGED